MGMTIKRVTFGTLVLLAILLPMRSPQRTVTPSIDTPTVSSRYFAAVNQYRTAQRAWTAFALRDSAVAALATAAAATVPVVSWRGFPSDVARPSTADSIVSALWQKIGAPRAEVVTSVVIYNAHAYRDERFARAMITNHGGRTSCVAIAPGYLTGQDGLTVGEYDLGAALAPCALLATFGAPGKSVADWLAATEFAPARSNAWLVPEDNKRPLGPWMGWSNHRPGANDYFAPRWLQMTTLPGVAVMREPPYMYGAAGLRCLNGDEQACSTSVLHPAVSARNSRFSPADLVGGNSIWDPESVSVLDVRPPNARFVSALITQFGRERFQRFWSSQLEFEPAFHDAFGQSLGSWTAQWARTTWAASYDAQHEFTDLSLGVTLKPYWLLSTMAWSSIAFMVAAAVAKRRTA